MFNYSARSVFIGVLSMCPADAHDTLIDLAHATPPGTGRRRGDDLPQTELFVAPLAITTNGGDRRRRSLLALSLTEGVGSQLAKWWSVVGASLMPRHASGDN